MALFPAVLLCFEGLQHLLSLQHSILSYFTDLGIGPKICLVKWITDGCSVFRSYRCACGIWPGPCTSAVLEENMPWVASNQEHSHGPHPQAGSKLNVTIAWGRAACALARLILPKLLPMPSPVSMRINVCYNTPLNLGSCFKQYFCFRNWLINQPFQIKFKVYPGWLVKSYPHSSPSSHSLWS